MAVPVVSFHQYDDASDTPLTTVVANSGNSATFPDVTVGNWTISTAFKVIWESGDANPIAVENTRLWVNRSVAEHRVTDTDPTYTEVDIGAGWPTAHWSIMALYTQDGLSISSVQALTMSATCPADCLDTGDTFSGAGAHTVAAAFKGQTSAAGVDLELSTGIAGLTLYSKFIGLSFKPNSTALRGYYSNVGLQITYDFS